MMSLSPRKTCPGVGLSSRSTHFTGVIFPHPLSVYARPDGTTCAGLERMVLGTDSECEVLSQFSWGMGIRKGEGNDVQVAVQLNERVHIGIVHECLICRRGTSPAETEIQDRRSEAKK